jgi:hypothetical protein
MREPRGYIVRIYRRGFRTFAGTVEDTQTCNKQTFKTTDELLVLLRAPIATQAAPRPSRRRSST